MKRPYIYILFSYILGIYISYSYRIEIWDFIAIGASTICIYLILKIITKKKHKILILITSLVLGALLFNHDYNKIEVKDEELYIEGIVTELKVKDKEYERYIIKYLDEGKNKKSVLTIYDETNLEEGDVIKVKGNVEGFQEARNPYSFNSKNNYLSQYIYTNIIAEKDNIEIISENQMSLAEGLRFKFKRLINTSVDENIKHQDRNLIKAMLLGKSDYLEEDLLENMRNVGLAHILAVSGLHIGIIFKVISLVLVRLGFNKRIAEIFALINVWIYIYLIDFPVSSCRAAIMITLLIISKLLHKRYDSVNIICFTAFIMLLYKPLWILNVGFQLSFIGVFFIAYPYKNKKIVGPIAIFLGLIPISGYYFNKIIPLQILSNIILSPVLIIALLSSMILSILNFFNIKLTIILGFFIEKLLSINSYMLETLSYLNISINMRSNSLKEMIIMYLIILIILRIIDVRKIDKSIMNVAYIYIS